MEVANPNIQHTHPITAAMPVKVPDRSGSLQRHHRDGTSGSPHQTLWTRSTGFSNIRHNAPHRRSPNGGEHAHHRRRETLPESFRTGFGTNEFPIVQSRRADRVVGLNEPYSPHRVSRV